MLEVETILLHPHGLLENRAVGFQSCDVIVSKKDQFWRLREAGHGGVFKLIHPEEHFRKCAVSVKMPALCKRKAEPTEYFCVFRETRLCVNGPLTFESISSQHQGDKDLFNRLFNAALTADGWSIGTYSLNWANGGITQTSQSKKLDRLYCLLQKQQLKVRRKTITGIAGNLQLGHCDG